MCLYFGITASGRKISTKICSKRTNVIDFVYFRYFLCMYFLGGEFQDRVPLPNPVLELVLAF